MCLRFFRCIPLVLSTETCPQWGGIPSEHLNEAVYAWELEIVRIVEVEPLVTVFRTDMSRELLYMDMCLITRYSRFPPEARKKKIDPRYFFFSGTPLLVDPTYRVGWFVGLTCWKAVALVWGMKFYFKSLWPGSMHVTKSTWPNDSTRSNRINGWSSTLG